MGTQTNFPDPNPLLDAVAAQLKVTSDRALSRALEFGAPAISRVRSGKRPVSDAMLISMHEETGWSIAELKSYLAKQPRALSS